MPGDKRSKHQRILHRQQISHLRLKHKTMQEIADELGISHATVKRELKVIHNEWRQASLEDISEVKARELAKLDLWELEVLTEWERSKQDWKKRVVEEKPGKTAETGKGQLKALTSRTAKIETGGSLGDPRYVNVLISIQERRAKLLGTDMPQKVSPTTPDGKEPYRPMTDAELDARILELQRKVGPEAGAADGAG